MLHSLPYGGSIFVLSVDGGLERQVHWGRGVEGHLESLSLRCGTHIRQLIFYLTN